MQFSLALQPDAAARRRPSDRESRRAIWLNVSTSGHVMAIAMAAIEPTYTKEHAAAKRRAKRLASGRIVIVCGGRDYLDRDRVFAAMDRAHAKQPITLVVHGACCDLEGRELQGADRWADQWAAERGVMVEHHPADWLGIGKAAGPLRNRRMAEAGAHGCIAFPGCRGTADMMRCTAAAGIPVWCPYGK